MENKIKNVFIEALSMSKNEEIDKSEILKIGEECGIEIPVRTSKANVVAKIVDAGYYDKLYEAFSEFIYIPVWSVADYFGINSDDVLQLAELGIITETPAEKEFYSRRSKDYYTANTYNIRILENYQKEDLKEKLRLANSGKGYKVRFETDTEEEIQIFIDELSKVFKLSSHKVYERRNTGFNTYLDVKILNNSKLEKNVLLEEIKNLKAKLKNQEKEYEEMHAKEIKLKNETIKELLKIIEQYKA